MYEVSKTENQYAAQAVQWMTYLFTKMTLGISSNEEQETQVLQVPVNTAKMGSKETSNIDLICNRQ